MFDYNRREEREIEEIKREKEEKSERFSFNDLMAYQLLMGYSMLKLDSFVNVRL